MTTFIFLVKNKYLYIFIILSVLAGGFLVKDKISPGANGRFPIWKQVIVDVKGENDLKKYSQTEDYYNWETAKDTKDPQILAKILEEGENDYVSMYAARNKNCPPFT